MGVFLHFIWGGVDVGYDREVGFYNFGLFGLGLVIKFI